MASESEIKAAIEKRVSSAETKDYSIWTIGVTDNADRRKAEHGNPKYWRQWNPDSETAARNVEKYFLDKGMKGAPGGPGKANYVYIF